MSDYETKRDAAAEMFQYKLGRVAGRSVTIDSFKAGADWARAELDEYVKQCAVSAQAITMFQAKLEVAKAALENICKKKPALVGQLEAADMAIEFRMEAGSALSQLEDKK